MKQNERIYTGELCSELIRKVKIEGHGWISRPYDGKMWGKRGVQIACKINNRNDNQRQLLVDPAV